ncbi:hypothetical protein ASG22_18845 [Chryseobacterium sp. Leaf405]|uniref:hypothetical protein n=1 Tax=Chryseobacterium sp. Leaf405 TaxID=1736367 RepID=UPI0006F97EAA|nr:hypothetical protein [Chryseobacterium sp. Leaf405]KQT31093.1 hypothetical protein ASG22_18845 [Chryseobacterium sp. Leaf405]
MKNLTLILFCLLANLFFGQKKFDDEKLMAVQDIFYNSTKKNINNFMTGKGYTVGEVEKGEGEDGDAHSFKSEFTRVQVQYNTDGSNAGVVMLYAGAINNAFIEMKIKDAGYTFVEHENVIDGVDFKRKQWSKKGEKYSFITYADDTDKVGFLAFGKFQE